jgi:hypothetical protein
MSIRYVSLSVILSAFVGLAVGNAAAGTVAQPDITSKNGITIGGAIGGAGGKFVPWGGTVTLAESDAFIKSNGHCAFNVAYDMGNAGTVATGLFKNWIVASGTTVAINSNLALNAGETKLIYTQPYLPQGSYELALRLDVENTVAESNELNNNFTIRVNFSGLCGAPAPAPAPTPVPVAKPDLVPGKGLVLGGLVGGSGGKSVAWGGLIQLTTADTFLQWNGKCAVNISYDIANVGNAAASNAFVDRILDNGTMISQQGGLTLDAGKTRTVNTQAYLVPGLNTLRLVVDADNAVAESNEANNTSADVRVVLSSPCGSTEQRK